MSEKENSVSSARRSHWTKISYDWRLCSLGLSLHHSTVCLVQFLSTMCGEGLLKCWMAEEANLFSSLAYKAFPSALNGHTCLWIVYKQNICLHLLTPEASRGNNFSLFDYEHYIIRHKNSSKKWSPKWKHTCLYSKHLLEQLKLLAFLPAFEVNKSMCTTREHFRYQFIVTA